MTIEEIRAKLAPNQEVMIKILGSGYTPREVLIRTTEYPPGVPSKNIQSEFSVADIDASVLTFDDFVGTVIDEQLIALANL